MNVKVEVNMIKAVIIIKEWIRKIMKVLLACGVIRAIIIVIMISNK